MGKEVSNKVEIEREGNLILMAGRGWIPYVHHGDVKTLNNSDIGSAAVKAGYKDGDYFKYKIIIEPKK